MHTRDNRITRIRVYYLKMLYRRKKEHAPELRDAPDTRRIDIKHGMAHALVDIEIIK